jgi:phosphinothricin acetyltransferase
MVQVGFLEITEAYLSQVLDIYNHYIQNSTATFHIQPLTWEEMRRIVFFTDPRLKTYIALDREKLAGYCILGRYKEREAYAITAEVTIYLHPKYTGRGIGSQALKFIERLARQNQFHSLLSGICGENSASIKLFEKNGYTRCAHYKEVGEKFGRLLDLVYYQKLL